MSARDRGYEEEFLDRAEREAGLMGLGFPVQVLERLDTYGAVHGDRWARMTLKELLREIRSEAADLGGWPALMAQQVLRQNGTVDDDVSLEARMLLQAIAAAGARVEHLCRQLGELLAD
ncbi:MAG: hypothetical protein M3340_12080 [Actinomycetota bacterium]|nr:hypothetical protein [Actinomycetota bacterium]